MPGDTVDSRPPNDTPDCWRCRRGLVMPDGVRKCPVHASPEERALVDALNERAPGVGLRPDREGSDYWDLWRWGYGAAVNVTTRQRMLDWAEGHGLRVAHNAHHCLGWLLEGRCAEDCDIDFRTRWYPATTEFITPIDFENPQWRTVAPAYVTGRWADHLSAWSRDGEPAVIVSQPYHLDPGDHQELEALQTASGGLLRLEVAREGWYGHGAHFVALWRTAVRRRQSVFSPVAVGEEQ